MAHKRKARHRHAGGRKFDPNARRRSTTRRGRRGEDDRDYGSPLLRARKLAATSRDDVEMTPAGVLYGHGHLDRYEYDTLGRVTELLQRTARSFGRGVSPAGIWNAILGALIKTTPGFEPIIGDHGARRQLEQICRRLDGSKDLVIELASEGPLPLICLRVLARRLTPRDLVQLESLRKSLDGVTTLRSGADEAS
jgi:hypothetical protein